MKKITKKIISILSITLSISTLSIVTPLLLTSCSSNTKTTEKNPVKPIIKEPTNPSVSDNTFEDVYKLADMYRIGEWNIMNFGSKTTTQNSLKVQAIAKAIWYCHMDLVGLTEINYGWGSDVKYIVNTLNQLANKTGLYSYVIQPENQANPLSSKATKEQVAIVYNTKLFEPIHFLSNKNSSTYGLSYNLSFQTESNQETTYKRPVYGAMFDILNKTTHQSTNQTITTMFAHLDSPDGKQGVEKKSKQFKEQGEQEVSEAQQLANVLAWFKTKSLANTNLFFGGDTNIKTKNDYLFDSYIKKGDYQSFYPDISKASKAVQEYYSTTLSTSISNPNYAQAYDKFLFKQTTLNFIDAEKKKLFSNTKYRNSNWKADIINAFTNGIWNKTWFEKLYQEQYPNSRNTSPVRMIRHAVSDHTLVWMDFTL